MSALSAPSNCGWVWPTSNKDEIPHQCNRPKAHRGKHHCWCGREALNRPEETEEVWRITGVAALYRSRQRSGTYFLLKNPSDPKADGIELTEKEAIQLAKAIMEERRERT